MPMRPGPHAGKSPAKSRASGVHRLSRPEPLNVAIADRGDAACRKPFADPAAREEGVFADAPAGMLRRDRLDLARHRRMQREQRNPGLESLDRLAVALLDDLRLDRQGAPEMGG